MKRYIILVLSFLLVTALYAQEETTTDKKSSKEIVREQKKAQRLAMEEAISRQVDSLMLEKRYVLEANYLSNQRGQRIIVDNLINFIIVDSSQITIQFASRNGMGGTNGLGGITTDGRITNYEVRKTGKGKGYYYIRLTAMTTLGIYDIFLNVNNQANADATISGNTAGKLNYHGIIRPVDDSRVFKGHSI